MANPVRQLVGWLVRRSAIIFLKGGKLHFNAPIGALFFPSAMQSNLQSTKQNKTGRVDEDICFSGDRGVQQSSDDDAKPDQLPKQNPKPNNK